VTRGAIGAVVLVDPRSGADAKGTLIALVLRSRRSSS
jgi:hypothetical protein